MPAIQANDDARTIVQTRMFDAPRELVFEAWTTPEHVAQWFGPMGFTTTTHEMSVKAGGVWNFIMHGPDGTDYPNRIEYEEVTPPERLVYSHGDGGARLFHVVITFEQVGAQTRLTMRSLFPTAEARDLVVEKYGAIEGGRQTLERLARYVASRLEKAS
ncbi:MAG: SRPBCC family protein [Thermoanaerobaculia bacterium]